MKTIWITGASSGLGEYLALTAAEYGYHLILTARRELELERVKRLIMNRHPQSDVLLFPGDVTNTEQLNDIVRSVTSLGKKIDILVANAGTYDITEGDQFKVANFRKVFDVNFFGVLNCIEAVLPHMLDRREGHIVGVSSVAGYRALPRATAYGSSKSALTYALESLRFYCEKHGIAVSVVSPGFVRTPLTDRNDFPMPCLMEPDAAARALLDGIEKKQMEIHFPKRFTWVMKILRIIPFPLYHTIIRRITAC